MDGGSLTQILELFPAVTMTEVSWGGREEGKRGRKGNVYMEIMCIDT